MVEFRDKLRDRIDELQAELGSYHIVTLISLGAFTVGGTVTAEAISTGNRLLPK